jgi:catechol 2,3-dioxygenase-like lactoylglutathione lyase family enzyme
MLDSPVLDHVATEEPDIDGRVRFLVDVLGLRLLRWGRHTASGGRIAMLADPHGAKLELIEVAERRGEHDHVAWRVPDVDAAHAALLAAGCTELRAPSQLSAARARTSMVREASGNRLQLIAYDADSPDLAAPVECPGR